MFVADPPREESSLEQTRRAMSAEPKRAETVP